jgi:hypothetical protein
MTIECDISVRLCVALCSAPGSVFYFSGSIFMI